MHNHLASIRKAAAPTNMIFLLLLSYISFSMVAVANAQQVTHSNVTLGSSLSPNTGNTSWLSPSGQFAFGFYPQGDGFALGIWFAKIREKTIVWSASPRDDGDGQILQVSGNATLLLSNDGWLILRDNIEGQDQRNIITLSAGSEPAVSAAMLDSGNFVLYNSRSGITWQSFDSPTNTILQGQSLSNGARLISSASETDQSRGLFQLRMQQDGNLVMYPIGEPDSSSDAYWASGTFGTGNSVKFEDNGQLYLVNGTGFKIRTLVDGWNSSTVGSTTVFYRMTLDVDGIFRVYSHGLDQNGNWSIKWTPPIDKCVPKGLCGINGFCVLMDQEPQCLCLPGFNFIDQGKMFLGCKRNSSINCRKNKEAEMYMEMHVIENTGWEDNPYSSVKSTTEENCQRACLEDCNCEVVLFAGQECKKQKLPLRYGRRQFGESTKTFVKMNLNTKMSEEDRSSNPKRQDQKGEENCKGRKRKHVMLVVIAAAFLSCSFLVLAISGVLIYKNHANYGATREILSHPGSALEEDISLKSFTYNELEKATNGFTEEVGRGAFGLVFKGTLLTRNNHHQAIAVKRLDHKLFDEEKEREFLTELRVIGKTHHRNLVKLLGYCNNDSNRLLVYEFMSKGTLADFLFTSKQRPSWDERLRIALNVARGILYLHEECETQIIHCDVKPQNILMDDWGCAKICDFGLAKLMKLDQTNTFTGIRGTRGYVAPEWHLNLPVTVKADVYSFGIVLLEIICCRKNLDASNFPEEQAVLADWVCECLEAGQIGEVLVGDDQKVDKGQFDRMVRVAIWCIQDEPSLRPCMRKVVLMLEGTIDIPTPPPPSSYLSSA